MNPLLIRSRGMMQAQQGGQHVSLQYITTNGQQRVITDIVVPSNSTVIKVVASVKDTSTAATSRMILCTGDSVNQAAYQLYANQVRFYCASSWTSKNTTSFFTLTGIRNPSTGKDVINNATPANWNGRAAGGQLIILSATYNLGVPSNYQNTKSIEVYFDDVLAADFIPVRIGTVAQWYDQLNNKYWRSDTGTDYIAGPDVQ